MTIAPHSSADHICDTHCPHHGSMPIVDPRSVNGHLGYRRDERAKKFPYLAALRDRVLIYDGGFGTELFKFDLGPEDLGTGQQDGPHDLGAADQGRGLPGAGGLRPRAHQNTGTAQGALDRMGQDRRDPVGENQKLYLRP